MFNIEQFWVGLMEGDGSIQVNHWRKKNLAYRLIIKLKNTLTNEKMLKTISKNIGGRVRISKSKGFCLEDVIWVEDDKERIVEIIKIFEKYPPLTARKYCQLEFMKACLKHNNIELYLKERDNKYFCAEYNVFKFSSLNNLPCYFPSWLSGFIEAEGCFSITAKGVLSFSIAQKYERNLIACIRDYFNALNYQVIIRPNELFEIKIYNKECLKKIILHCTDFPLQGEKKESLEKFKQLLK
jgi:hypothetical protein